MKRRRYITLEFLHDNDARIWVMMYDRCKMKTFTVPFWKWLRHLDSFRGVTYECPDDWEE